MTTYNVGSLSSLKAALLDAATNGQADTITFTQNLSATSSSDLVSGTGGSDVLRISLTDGMTLSIVGGGFTLDANHFGRVLEVSSGSAVSISNLTIREGSLAAAGGDHSQAGGAALGGGIYNAGSLTLTGVTVTANSAAGGGGGGGGYYSGGGSGAGGGANDGSRFAGDGGSGFGGRGGGTTYSGAGASSGSGGAGGVPSNSYIDAASGGTSGGGGGGYYNGGQGGDGGTAAVGGGLSASGNIGGGISIGGGGGGAGQYTGFGGGATHGVGAGGAAAGGIYNAGDLVLSGGVVSGNVAAGGGGGVNPGFGVHAVGGAAVGGIQNAGVLRLEGAATVTGNVGVAGVGGHVGLESPVVGVSSADFSGTAAVVNHAPTGGVSITGTATQGQVLTATNTLADTDGLGTLSYQWKSDAATISGATASTFTLTQAQVGHVLSVAVSYTDGGSTAESVTSGGTASVANVNDAPTGSVTISGIATQGQILTAANTLADADGLGTISYHWRSDGADISGATGGSFVLTSAQVGHAVTVAASYTDGFSHAESVVSGAVTPAALPPVVDPDPPAPPPPSVITVMTPSGDIVTGDAQDNTIVSSGGADTVSAGEGNDTVSGGGLDDVLQGNQGQDSIAAGGGADVVYGGQGNDFLQGNAGNDVLYGDKGNDSVLGGQGADTVQGGQGDDYVSGDLGDDVLRGGQGNDRVVGGAGNDFLSGDLGNDTLTGGTGADTFHSFGAAGIDLVTDFNLAEGDHIQLDAGTAYTVSQVGSDVHIDMAGGAEMILAGVQLSSLHGDWISA